MTHVHKQSVNGVCQSIEDNDGNEINPTSQRPGGTTSPSGEIPQGEDIPPEQFESPAKGPRGDDSVMVVMADDFYAAIDQGLQRLSVPPARPQTVSSPLDAEAKPEGSPPVDRRQKTTFHFLDASCADRSVMRKSHAVCKDAARFYSYARAAYDIAREEEFVLKVMLEGATHELKLVKEDQDDFEKVLEMIDAWWGVKILDRVEVDRKRECRVEVRLL